MKKIPILCLIVVLGGCIKPYMPNLNNPPTGYLVVEGNINNGTVPTIIHLSRTEPLTSNAPEIFEEGATVALQGSDGSTYNAAATGVGLYSFGILNLDSTKTYRLDIHTKDTNEFQSDYVPVIPNPPIDSVNGIQKADGMHIYVNTHNPAGNTRYYQWSFSETWEYHSAEPSNYEWDDIDSLVVARPPSDQIFTCWNTDSSASLLLYSTTKLSADVVYEFPLNFIPTGDQRLSVEYSLAVYQYALSEAAYNYLTLMQSNTENLGSIFDPLPSGLKGNIHNLTHPTQTVVGYVNVSSTQFKRVFLQTPPGWGYYFQCQLSDITLTPGDNIKNAWYFTGTQPYPLPLMPNGEPVPAPVGIYIPLDTAAPGAGWYCNLKECVDCRVLGGANVQPSFWQ